MHIFSCRKKLLLDHCLYLKKRIKIEFIRIKAQTVAKFTLTNATGE